MGLLAGLLSLGCGGGKFESSGSGGSSTGGEGGVTSGGAAMSGGNPATGGAVTSGGVGEVSGGAATTMGGHPAGGSETGGSPATGGAVTSGGSTSEPTGGFAPTGGTVGAGGSSGGSPGTGGTATGGQATGGTNVGGTATGGRATGGTSVGGTATGGTAMGGKNTGGTGGIGYPECAEAKDCALFTGCCSCLPMPVGSSLPICNISCIQSDCDARGIGREEVACIAGRCVFNRTCSAVNTVCSIPAPSCVAGEVPLLLNGCYAGGCARPEDCADVDSCEVCKDPGLSCATFEVLPPSHHCVTSPPECQDKPTCACMGVCSGVMSCVQPDSTDLICQCPGC
jgi:hypothetical protein